MEVMPTEISSHGPDATNTAKSGRARDSKYLQQQPAKRPFPAPENRWCLTCPLLCFPDALPFLLLSSHHLPLYALSGFHSVGSCGGYPPPHCAGITYGIARKTVLRIDGTMQKACKKAQASPDKRDTQRSALVDAVSEWGLCASQRFYFPLVSDTSFFQKFSQRTNTHQTFVLCDPLWLSPTVSEREDRCPFDGHCLGHPAGMEQALLGLMAQAVSIWIKEIRRGTCGL